MQQFKSFLKQLIDPYHKETERLKQYERSIKGISNVSFHFEDSAGNYIDFKELKVPHDRYIPLAAGLLNRILLDPKHIIFSWEKPILRYTELMDFDRGTVIISRAEKGVSFPKHFHIELETLLVVTGAMEVTTYENGIANEKITLTPGKKIILAPFEPHEVSFKKESIVLANLIPKVPEILYK